MYKILIFLCFFFLNSDLKSQEKSSKINIIYEVDSLIKNIKKSENDQLIIYYLDGASKSGIILWKTNNIKNGVAFRKAYDKFVVKNISVKNINGSRLLNQFADSFEVFQKSHPYASYQMSHDFNLVWIYTTKKGTDSICKKFSDIVGGGDQIGRYIYFKFDKLYDLSMPPLKYSARRKKIPHRQ